jgi:dihydropteroate synthase
MGKITELLAAGRAPLFMGILNVTPDSFSDGGCYVTFDKAVAHAEQMICEGAVIIDIGPESTRPGSLPVPATEQLERAIPVIREIKKRFDVLVSIDTFNADVAWEAVNAGADIVNDITAASDERMFEIAAGSDVDLILMHMKGKPENMQQSPVYDDVFREVYEYLQSRARKAQSHGVCADSIIIDPGIGFGKTLTHNVLLTQSISRLKNLGYPVMYGASRKSFIGTLTGRNTPSERLGGTIATTIFAARQGAAIIRVHDVAANADAVRMYSKLC